VDDPDLAEYQGRRRASVAGPGRVRGPVLVAGGVAAAVLVVLSLVVIVLTAPQKPSVPVTADPAPAAPPPASPGSESPAAPSPSAPSPSRSPSRSPSPTPAPSRPPVRPSAPTPPSLVQPLSYEAEAPGNVLLRGARVAPMDSASGGSGVYALGASNGGTLLFTGIAGGTGGRYTVTVYFQNPDSGDRTGRMTVNGGAPVTLRYRSTGDCCVASTSMVVVLAAGTGNTIEFGNPASRSADIDRIVANPA
jgi:Alpha-galactosidase, CBM13 domain